MDLSPRFCNGFLGNGQGAPGLSEAAVQEALAAARSDAAPPEPTAPPPAADGSKSPAADGSKAAPAGEKERAAGRDAAGRFLPGCPGGPGNPYNRRVALYKACLLAAVSPEEVTEIGRELAAKAKQGCVAAARVLFQYILPKNVEPDALDLQEWDNYKKQQGMLLELPGLLQTPEPDFPLSIMRATRPGMTRDIAQMTGGALALGPEGVRDLRTVPVADGMAALRTAWAERKPGTTPERPATAAPGKARGKRRKPGAR